MKKALLLIPLIIAGLYYIGDNAHSSGTYTPSVNINISELPKGTKSIVRNMKSWFDNSFEPIATIPGIKEAWRHKIYKKIILNYVDIERVRPIGLKDFKPKTYVKGLGEARNFIHVLGGIKKWKLTKAKFDNKRKIGLARIRLKGRYYNSKRKKIIFHENHIFQGRHFRQYQLTMPANIKTEIDDKVASALLKYLEKRQ